MDEELIVVFCLTSDMFYDADFMPEVGLEDGPFMYFPSYTDESSELWEMLPDDVSQDIDLEARYLFAFNRIPKDPSEAYEAICKHILP
jgi:hypothetical protein